MSLAKNSRSVSANTPEAPPAPPVEGAEVVEGGKRTRRGRTARAPYPNIPATGLAAWPGDYNPNVHGRLKPTDFADECVYCSGMQSMHTRIAQEYADRGSMLAALGTVKDREQASKAVRLIQQLEILKQQMAESGVDPEVVTRMVELAKKNAAGGVPVKA